MVLISKKSDPRLKAFREYLNELFPEPECALLFETPFQLLIATILSAQCTDKQVNKVTPNLFAKYPNAQDIADADIADIEKSIKSIGIYKNKAKNIHGASKAIMEWYNGEVPSNMKDLVALPGVGRKTANVVLGNAFGIPGMVVDTHVKRIANRYGMTQSQDPAMIEQDLMAIIPEAEWTVFSHQLVFFGRTICIARKPNCTNCKVSKFCPTAVI